MKNKIVEKIDTSKTKKPGLDPGGMVRVTNKNNTIFPSMYVKKGQEDHQEIVLHELIHYYINPYLHAAHQQKEGVLQISDATQEKVALDLFDSVSTLYEEAKKKGYTVTNGTSLEETIEEFVANITHEKSVEELKNIGVYDGLFGTLKKHIDTISSVEIPYTIVSKKAA